jgi:hypothetical protein
MFKTAVKKPSFLYLQRNLINSVGFFSDINSKSKGNLNRQVDILTGGICACTWDPIDDVTAEFAFLGHYFSGTRIMVNSREGK